MNVFKAFTRNLTLCFSILSFCLLFGCQKIDSALRSEHIDHKHPLGQSWQARTAPIEKFSNVCEKYTKNLINIFSAGELKNAIEKCTFEQYDQVFLPRNELPNNLNDSSVSIIYKNGIEPIAFNYSYLDDLVGGKDQRKRTKLRFQRARQITTQLVEKYGQPIAEGYFDQGASLGYVFDNKERNDCKFWFQGNIIIALCSERIILIDGIELSLSYIRSDHSAYGRALEAALMPGTSVIDSQPTASFTPEPNEFTKQLKDFSESIDQSKFNWCKRDDLQPLEFVLKITDDERRIIEPILNKYKGDELSEYIFESIDHLFEGINKDREDNILMFLLKKASDQNSASAMNEIGGAFLYCNHGVQQDIPRAQEWLQLAIDDNDPLAMSSLARMHLMGLTQSITPKQDAVILLEQCAALKYEYCVQSLNTIMEIIDHKNE